LLDLSISSSAPYFPNFYSQMPLGEANLADCNVMLISVVCILGKATRYLQQDGVKGDYHFPWHQQSRLSTIRDELEAWASEVSNRSIEQTPLPVGPASTQSCLSRCIYHLIHILIYRPFLPFSLHHLEPENEGRQRAWHAEVIDSCLHHANCIADLFGSASMFSRFEVVASHLVSSM
jgi:hypothetical protein